MAEAGSSSLENVRTPEKKMGELLERQTSVLTIKESDVPQTEEKVEDDVMAVDPEEALAIARKQVSDVQEELVQLRREIQVAKKRALVESRNSVLQAVRHAHASMPTHPEARPHSHSQALDPVEVERSMRHLEADRDEARARADRLMAENNQLMAKQAQVEAQLKQAHHTLGHTTRQLRHRELDLQHLGGSSVSSTKESADQSIMPGGPSCMDSSLVLAGSSRIQDTNVDTHVDPAVNSFHEAHCKPGAGMSKKQGVAAIASLQAQLQQEQQRRRKLQQKAGKDRERLEGLFQLAERQRDELASLRRGSGLRSPTAELPVSPFGGFASFGDGENGSLLMKSPSAPTKLPSVGRRG